MLLFCAQCAEWAQPMQYCCGSYSPSLTARPLFTDPGMMAWIWRPQQEQAHEEVAGGKECEGDGEAAAPPVKRPRLREEGGEGRWGRHATEGPTLGELDRSCDELVPRRLELRKDSVLTASGQLKPGVSVRFRVLGECRPGIKPAARLEIIRSGGEAEVPTWGELTGDETRVEAELRCPPVSR